MPDRALALMQEETQRSPESKGKEALLVATAEADGKSDVALSELQKMAAQNPASAEVQIRIGALQQKNGKLPEALQAFERARQLAPDRKGLDASGREPARNASVRRRKRSRTTARLLLKSPGDPTVLNNLAFLLAETGGDTKEALDLVSTAHPQDAERPTAAGHAGVDTNQAAQHGGGASDSADAHRQHTRRTTRFAITMRWR